MIQSNEEYKSAIDFISKDLEMYDFELSDKMTSYEYNLYLQDIEYYMNILYEKTRTIEDIINYVSMYCEAKTKKVKDEIAENEEILESNIDRFIGQKSMSYNVIWDINNINNIKDRDGEKLPPADISNNIVSFGKTILNKIEPLVIIKNSNHITDSDNILTGLNDGYYMTSYYLDKPDVIVEDIYIKTKNNDTGQLNMTPMNCEIEYVGLENDKQHYRLTAKNMEKKAQTFSYDNFNGSMLNKINNRIPYSYNVAEDINTNKNNIEQLRYKNNNKKYLNDVMNYQKISEIQEAKSETQMIINHDDNGEKR